MTCLGIAGSGDRGLCAYFSLFVWDAKITDDLSQNHLGPFAVTNRSGSFSHSPSKRPISHLAIRTSAGKINASRCEVRERRAFDTGPELSLLFTSYGTALLRHRSGCLQRSNVSEYLVQ